LQRTSKYASSSVFSRLAYGAFYETIVLVTSCEIIKVDGF
jgi:hypothetical protein